MTPPSFVTGLKPETEVRDGSRLELAVKVKGDPDPQVTWTKDGKPLSSSEILEVKYKNGLASVTINEVFPEDAGRYACKASNAKGAVEAITTVKVMAGAKTNGVGNGKAGAVEAKMSPSMFGHVTSAVAKDGDAVALQCTVTNAGNRYDVVWLHNEKEIKPSKDFVYKSEGDKHVLEIVEVFPEDAGTYTCEAFNDVGECFTTCTIEVECPGETLPGPRFKTFPKSLTVAKNSTAKFECETFEAAKEVAWMKDGKELKEIPLKLRLEKAKTGKTMSLGIVDASEADSGQYAVIAVNDKGESKAAFSLNVRA